MLQERDFEIELAPAWQAVPHDGGFEWRRADGSQLIITTYHLAENSPQPEVLARMVELRHRAEHDVDPRCEQHPVTHVPHADRLVATYTTTTSDRAVGSFVAIVASKRPVAGEHVVLTFAFTGTPAQLPEARALYETLRFMPHADAVRRAEATAGMVDPGRLYPYLAPEGYVPGRAPFRSIGHGVVLLLAQDADGVASVLHPEDVTKSGVSVSAAIERAHANLEARLAAGDIPIRQYDVAGTPLVRFGEHWLAAACLLLPTLRDFMRRTLGTDKIAASIPHRDVLACFACDDPRIVMKLGALLRKNESDGRKPLTWNLFTLAAGGPRAFAPGGT